MTLTMEEIDYHHLSRQIKEWGKSLGFQQVSITDIDLPETGERLNQWLQKGYQGDMQWMSEHGEKRYHPEQLLPGTQRVISVRMDYLPDNSNMIAVLKDEDKAYISRYALGRDYHKVIRQRLKTLSKEIEQAVPGSIIQRPYVDSAPVMEKPLAEKAGLGWVGKHTMVINSEAGSWFFLGEIYTSLPLPIDQTAEKDQCGDCKACLKVCPTDAFPKPYVLDARRCISYLTIEHKGSIPVEFREPMGNRVFGCDDCQAVCPWNKEAAPTQEKDFSPRHNLDNRELTELFLWTEAEFLKFTEGSPIRRVGYERWLRNLAVGLGNAPTTGTILDALKVRENYPSSLVQEHVAWAQEQHLKSTTGKKKRKRKIKNPKVL
jgi:epoxyqueuosine reductase